MRFVLNAISFVSSYAVGISALYLVQYYTIGLIPALKHWTIGRFMVKDIVFLLVAIIVLTVFFNVHLPY